MAGHPLSSSERRGILIVACISLLIVGGGLCATYCQRPESIIEPQEVEVLMRRDSVAEARADSVIKARRDSIRKVHRDSIRKVRRDSLRRTKRDPHSRLKSKEKGRTPKTYRRRSPLDEPVD